MAAASVASALLAVTRKNPVHSVLWVLALFVHMAGMFLLLDAEFLAAVQIIVYAGAILIFYLFVVMLLDLPDEHVRPRFEQHWPYAAFVGLSFAAMAWLVRTDIHFFEGGGLAKSQVTVPSSVTTDVPTPGSLEDLGIELFGPFALPFEMASLVLLAAIVGAVVLVRRKGVGA